MSDIPTNTGKPEYLAPFFASVFGALNKLHRANLAVAHPQYCWVHMAEIVVQLGPVLEAGGAPAMQPTLAVQEAFRWPKLRAEVARLAETGDKALLHLLGIPSESHLKAVGKPFNGCLWLWQAVSVAFAAQQDPPVPGARHGRVPGPCRRAHAWPPGAAGYLVPRARPQGSPGAYAYDTSS